MEKTICSLFNLVCLISVLGLLFGCGKTKETTLFKTDCNGIPLTFSAMEKPHYSTIQFWMEIKLGKLPIIKLSNNEVFDQTPYSLEVLKGSKHYFYDTTDKTALFGNGKIDRRKVFIFINPTQYSESDFEAINNCLLQHHSQMETALYTKYISNRAHFNFPQFAGIVYAQTNDFNEVYRSSDNDKTITIYFNGKVGLKEKNADQTLGYVTRKQKENTTEYIPKLDVSTLKNVKSGRSILEDYFIYEDKDGLTWWLKK